MPSSSSLRVSSAAFLASRTSAWSSAWRQLTSRAMISTTTKKAWTPTRPRVSGRVCRPGPKTWSGAITPTTAWWKTTKPTDSANGSQSR